MNQHYIHHNAVLPGAGVLDPSGKTRNAGGDGSGTPLYKDPYANISMKPNQMSVESAYQLQKQVLNSTPAGVISDLRKSSPSGHKVSDERTLRNDRGGASSVGRAGNQILNDYRMPAEYGSIQKVMPGSRDPAMNEGGSTPVYSSKPSANYQHMSIEH